MSGRPASGAPSHALLDAFRDTDYRVRLATGGHASLRIGQLLPPALYALVPIEAPWAYLTAWNPFAERGERRENRRRQRRLLDVLRSLEPVSTLRAGMGVGAKGWREASLFVVGIDSESLDALLQRFEQHAAVAGRGHGTARLHWHP